jgi:hypothetical protein
MSAYNAAAQVNAVFQQARTYAASAQSGVGSFAGQLGAAMFDPPTISATWATISSPTIPTISPPPQAGSIEFTAPVAPSDLSLPNIEIRIDDFTDTAPNLSFGTAPTLDYGTAPVIPELASVEVPEPQNIVMPPVPTYLSLATVTFDGVNTHDDWLSKLEDIPELELVAPTPYSYNRGPDYASALLTELKGKITARLAGGTGLDPDVEQAIWDRARSRETQTALANEAEILRQAEALGFDLPSGTLAAQLRDAQKNYYDKLSTLSRDISIKQAELEQENLKQTIAEGMQLEAKLIDYSTQMERLAFESATQYANNAIQVHNASVEGYKALLSSYQAYSQAYDTIIKAELSKVEVYKAELQAEMTKAQINTSMVEQYKATISAEMSKVEIYKAQVSAASTLVQLEQAKIGAAGEQIKAYVARINAETAKVEAYKATVQAEAVKLEEYKTKAQVFSAKTGAQAEKARVEIGRYQAMTSAKGAEWEGYKARVQAETARMQGVVSQTANRVEGYKASAAAAEAQASMTARIWESEIKQYEASIQMALQTQKMNADVQIATNAARLDGAKVGAQVYAQLAASAYSMLNASAGISDGSSYSKNDNYSYEGAS